MNNSEAKRESQIPIKNIRCLGLSGPAGALQRGNEKKDISVLLDILSFSGVSNIFVDKIFIYFLYFIEFIFKLIKLQIIS